MSTYTSEPGTRLAGRYLLVDQAIGGTDWTYWKAIDETLARSVTVLTFAAGFDRVREVVAAARAASRLNDPRFSQVFDVEDADGSAYVVLEWVASESLLDMLADGPLDPPRAVSLISEAAQALAAAHATGLAHLRLDPACVHWTPRGGIKITGLGIAAALTGGQAAADGGEDPDLADTRGLARLLYAALTRYWPEPWGYSRAFGPGEAPEPGSDYASVGLPPAPQADGMPCTPHQVSADVPTNIDAVTCQALFQRPSRHGPALSTPATFADALASVAPPAPLPVPAPASAPVRQPAPGRAPRYQPTGPAQAYPAADQARTTLDESAYRQPRPPRHFPPTRAVLAVVIAAALVAAGVVGWSLTHRPGHSGSPQASGQTSSSSSSSAPDTAASNVLRPAGANSFDPLGSSKDENGNEAQYAIDNDPSTFWHSDFYDGSPTFGNLKAGTGLILDMGGQVRLSQVVVQFGTICCAHVDIEIGNDNTPAAATLNTFTQVQSSDSVVGSTTFDVTSHATGRYVLIWITYLPRLAGSSNRFEVMIYNIVVHGSPVSQSG